MNARQEFENHVKGKVVECAKITIGEYKQARTFVLKQGYTEIDYRAFLYLLDIEYDDGYGGQNLFGTMTITYSAEIAPICDI